MDEMIAVAKRIMARAYQRIDSEVTSDVVEELEDAVTLLRKAVDPTQSEPATRPMGAWARKRIKDTNAIKPLFDAGHSIDAIARELGLNRGRVYNITRLLQEAHTVN